MEGVYHQPLLYWVLLERVRDKFDPFRLLQFSDLDFMRFIKTASPPLRTVSQYL